MMARHTVLPAVLLLLLVTPLECTLEKKYKKLDDDSKAADGFELMTIQNVSSSIQCAARCTRTKHCNTYGYCKNTRTCQMARLSVYIKFDIQLQPATGFKVYSSGKWHYGMVICVPFNYKATQRGQLSFCCWKAILIWRVNFS